MKIAGAEDSNETMWGLRNLHYFHGRITCYSVHKFCKHESIGKGCTRWNHQISISQIQIQGTWMVHRAWHHKRSANTLACNWSWDAENWSLGIPWYTGNTWKEEQMFLVDTTPDMKILPHGGEYQGIRDDCMHIDGLGRPKKYIITSIQIRRDAN